MDGIINRLNSSLFPYKSTKSSGNQAFLPKKKEPVSQNSKNSNSIIDSMQSYSESLRASRNSSKDTSLKLKQLKYNFKSISSKLMRTKTSTSARQVASEAKREVLRLKRQKQSAVDKEELQYAISHAEAMERVAKKRARHLLEEEMLKTGEKCLGEMDEDKLEDEALNESEECEDFDEEEFYEEDSYYADEMQEYELFDIDIESMEALESAMLNMDELMGAFEDEMMESMEELLEELGLMDDLSASAFGSEDDVDPEDIKMMKIKHRNSELKDIVKADADYLKKLFDHYGKMLGTSMTPAPTLSAPNEASMATQIPTINVCV